MIRKASDTDTKQITRTYEELLHGTDIEQPQSDESAWVVQERKQLLWISESEQQQLKMQKNYLGFTLII